jgi:hypothetical protein
LLHEEYNLGIQKQDTRSRYPPNRIVHVNTDPATVVPTPEKYNLRIPKQDTGSR